MKGALVAIARKEFRDRVRSRWVWVVAVVFALFSLAIAFLGGAAQGAVGLRSVEAAVASLTSLAIFLVPLIALMLGYDAIVGERERGTLDLLLSLPIPKGAIVIGKFLGLGAALAVATGVGLGGAGIVMTLRVGWSVWGIWAQFTFGSILLGLDFLAIALWLSTWARDRSRASGMAIVVWFVLVLVFDLVLLAAMVLLGAHPAGRWLPWVMFLNPADLFRVWGLAAAGNLQALRGVTDLFPAVASRPLWLALALVAWLAIPLVLANYRFRRNGEEMR
ncbi:ABC transporter permease subunit [Hydrogenophilus islandicus]